MRLHQKNYSLILSSFDTACHKVTLTCDGMFGSCVTSSSMLIAFAARTDMEYCPFVRSATMSVIFFFIVFGVATFEDTSFSDRSASCMVAVFSFSVGNLIKPLQKRRRFPL